jgi:glycosyltransferase involved in cell wall biosynthesis
MTDARNEEMTAPVPACSAPKRLVVFAFDFPYPANRGGRADIWRRLLALKDAGCDVMLVCWVNADAALQPTEDEIRFVGAQVRHVLIHRIKRGPLEALVRLSQLWRLPSHVAARRIKGRAWNDLLELARTFNADAIWTEGPACGEAAEKLARTLSLPLFYRSHNIEHLYMARQAKAAVSLRDKFAWRLACIGLRRYELRLMRFAQRVFDCSIDDLAFWRALGVSHGEWLAPLPEAALAPAIAAAPAPDGRHDVLFLGNLTTPNNVRGVEFLLNDVLPRVLQKRPGARFTIAGSRPTAYVRSLLAAYPGVTFLENVPDAWALLQTAKVLVNPVRTGSGIHVKALDMLMTDAPIVCTSQGVCGMPEELRRLFHVHDDAAGFAAAIIAALEARTIDLAARRHARRLFSRAAITALVAQIGTDAPRASVHQADARGPCMHS